MATHDYVIANGTGAAVRSDLNGALAAIVSNNSSATEPATMYAYQWWADTTTGTLKLRNASNSAWITLFQLDGEWSTLALENGTAAAPSIYFKDSGTDTGVYSPGTDQVGISTGGTVRLTTSTTAFTGTLPWRGQDGTVSAPAISFDSDIDTGIYRIGANQLGITTNGVERVNIGTTEVVWNDGGADIDFRVEGDTKANLFKIDAGTDTVSIDGTFTTGTVNYPTEGSLSGRNRIINGDMRIDARNAGASVTAQGYTLDRWFLGLSQSSKLTLQQNAGSVTPPAGFSHYLGITSSSAYSITLTDGFVVVQAIEGFNTSSFAWGTASAVSVTLSFWVRSSLTGTFGGAIKNSANTRSYPFSYTISASNTWEYKSITIPGDTSGTWLTDNGIGLQLKFGLGVGSTYSGTAGTWASSNFDSATGATSVVGTNGATFYLTGVQLEAGSTATPFERRSYGQELALCQRYYEAKGAVNFSMWPPVSNNAGNIAARRAWVAYVVEKRASPTVTVSKSQGLTSESTLSYTNGFSYNGDQGSFLETIITAWTASAEL